nr:hypothetical protein [Natrinema ejinorense]
MRRNTSGANIVPCAIRSKKRVALRARNRVGNKEKRRIRDLNHKASRRLIDWAQQFENPVLKIEDLEGIREGE